ARGYFKNIDGKIIDTFVIRVDADTFSSLTAARRPSAALLLSRAKLRRDHHSHQDWLSLQGSFVAPPDSINPPSDGVTLSLIDRDGHVVEDQSPGGRRVDDDAPGAGVVLPAQEGRIPEGSDRLREARHQVQHQDTAV